MEIISGFVKISGASDFEDSSVAAGLCALIGYYSKSELDLSKYIKADGTYQRCENSKYLFSRDQTLCLVAGFLAHGLTAYVDQSRVDGKDIFSPANKGHLKRCKGLKASFFEDMWLRLEILFHAKFTPLEESNQLIAMMIVAGPEYLKLWTKLNPQWEQSILLYWDSWRNEKEFGICLVNFIKGMIA